MTQTATIYDRDGKDWEEQALPIGNGYLGAMLFGMPGKDHIQFNEESFLGSGLSRCSGKSFLRQCKQKNGRRH